MKKYIIGFILGIIVSSGVAFAVTQINASDVTYTDSKNQETTVDEALNSLYTTQTTTVSNLQTQLNTCQSNPILQSLTIKLRAGANSTTKRAQADLQNMHLSFSNYKYFKFRNLVKSNTDNSCTLMAYSTTQGTWIRNLLEDTEYEINGSTDGNGFVAAGVEAYSHAETWDTCTIEIVLYNK